MLTSSVQRERLDIVHGAFKPVAEHNGSQSLKIGRAAACVLALAAAAGCEHVAVAQITHRRFRRSVRRPDKDDVFSEIRAYRVGYKPIVSAAEQQSANVL